MKKFRITVDGKTYEVEVEEVATNNTNASTPMASLFKGSTSVTVPVNVPSNDPVIKQDTASAPKTANSPDTTPKNIGAGTEVKAPVTGTILKVEAKPGDQVQAGQNIMILEAMKMETEVQSPVSGTIVNIFVSNGANVNSGQTLFVIESNSV